MRNYLNEYQVYSCLHLDEALNLMQQDPKPIPFAGGTDLMVLLHNQKLPSGIYLNLNTIQELQSKIDVQEKQIIFSALTTYHDVRMHPYFKNNMIILPLAASLMGGINIQNMGTWAGNIANASPAADGVPALMLYDAQVCLQSKNSKRTILLSDFYQGYKLMDKKSDEIITSIIIPKANEPAYEYYRKVGERKAQAISKVICGIRLEWDENKSVRNARVIFGSVMPYTYRSHTLEQLLQGEKITSDLIHKGIDIIGNELHPIDDIRSNACYRLQVAKNLWKEALSNCLQS